MGNEIRLGKVSAIDYATGMVRVVYHEKDDSVTRLIPLISNEYEMPEVEDQVLVLHLSNGTEAGVVIGRPWSEKNKPPEGAAGLYRKEMARTPGEAMIRYKDGTLTLKAGSVVVNGNLTVTGSLNVQGAITAQSVEASGDVVAGGISLMHHTHTDSMSGSTTPPV
jgi:phage baseplate assembly protein gpV